MDYAMKVKEEPGGGAGIPSSAYNGDSDAELGDFPELPDNDHTTEIDDISKSAVNCTTGRKLRRISR